MVVGNTPAPLCPPCIDERNRWLDTKPQDISGGFGFILQAQVDTSYNRTPRGRNEPRRMRYERWRETVRFQRDLIANTCRARGHASLAAAAPPRIVQLDLLDFAKDFVLAGRG